MSEDLTATLTFGCILIFSLILGYWRSLEARLGIGIETTVMTAAKNKHEAFQERRIVGDWLENAAPVDRVKRELDGLRELILRKNSDYGGSAFEAPSLMPGLSPTAAILVRMSDKINRLQTLAARRGESQVREETFNDTIRDLAGYCILYLASVETYTGTETAIDN